MPTASGNDYRELSLHSLESDSDDNFHKQDAGTGEDAQQDENILREEDEREKITLGQKEQSESSDFYNGNEAFKDRLKPKNAKSKKFRNQKTRRRKHEGLGEDGELLYEMEEGGQQSETSSQASSNLVELEELDKLNLQSKHASKVNITERPMI